MNEQPMLELERVAFLEGAVFILEPDTRHRAETPHLGDSDDWLMPLCDEEARWVVITAYPYRYLSPLGPELAGWFATPVEFDEEYAPLCCVFESPQGKLLLRGYVQDDNQLAQIASFFLVAAKNWEVLRFPDEEPWL